MESLLGLIVWCAPLVLIIILCVAAVASSNNNEVAQPQMKGSKKLFGMSEKGDAVISKYDSLQGLSADEMLDLGFLTYGTLTAAQLQQNMNDMQMNQQFMDQMQMDAQMNQQFMDQMQRDMNMQMNQMQMDMQYQMDLNDPCNYGVLSGNEDIFQNDMNSFGGGFDSFGGMGF